MKEFAEMTRDMQSPSLPIRLAAAEALSALVEYAIFEPGGIDEYFDATILAVNHPSEYSHGAENRLIEAMLSAQAPSLRGLAALALTNIADIRALVSVGRARDREAHPVVQIAEERAIVELIDILFQGIDQDLPE